MCMEWVTPSSHLLLCRPLLLLPPIPPSIRVFSSEGLLPVVIYTHPPSELLAWSPAHAHPTPPPQGLAPGSSWLGHRFSVNDPDLGGNTTKELWDFKVLVLTHKVTSQRTIVISVWFKIDILRNK